MIIGKIYYFECILLLYLCSCNRCSNDEYQCYHGGCLNKTVYCNGVPDCADYSDEPKLCGNNITIIRSKIMILYRLKNWNATKLEKNN